jgi:multicomponent Na+:H+ antiporter subunit A
MPSAPQATSPDGAARLRAALGAAAAYAPAALSAAAALWFWSFAEGIAAGTAPVFALDWLPAMGVSAAFRLDGLSLAFALLVTGVGALVLLYAPAYFAGDPRLPRVLTLLVLFEAAMLGLVTADDAVSLFVFWEITTVVSYLLVGYDHEKAEARAKAWQALLVTGLGGLALLAGLILLGEAMGTWRLSEMAAAAQDPRALPAYPVILALVCLGCFTKSAQVPFHFWLPNAMAAPTPVSAYLHSATMVKAGVYLLARLTPELGGTQLWIWTLTLVGGATMLVGAVWALRQTDLKLMLAYTTVSGLGSLVMFLGGADAVAIAAASTFLFVHAFYKAALFLVVGILDKKAGGRDLTALGGLARAMPVTWMTATLAAFSMAGFPPLLGFIGKELKYEGALAVASEPLFVAAVAVVSNMLMVTVGMVFALTPFLGLKRSPNPRPADPSAALMVGPALLAAGGLAFGLAPEVLETLLVQPMATAIQGGPIRVELKLYHGVNLPLMLSVITFAGGIAAYFAKPRLRALLGALEPSTPRAEAGYDAAFDGLKRGAAWVARTVQTGRLTDYLRVTAGALAALALGAVAIGGGALGPPPGPLAALEAGVLLLIAGAAAALPFARSRLYAISALGLVGAGVAVVFALYGAVDVAMTQLLVEILVVVIFSVALLRLPHLAPARAGVWPGVIAGAGGLGATLALLAALETPLDRRLTGFFETAAWPEAHGRNIVNVILVDFRALDTFGEILVVAVAAVAALAALRAGRSLGADR